MKWLNAWVIIWLSLFTSDTFYCKANEHIPLTDHWQFKYKDQWLATHIPSSIHTDLFSYKLIDDPYYGDNEKKLQWIEQQSWEYRTNFIMDQKTLDQDHIELVFKGLDTYAAVYLNEQLILQAQNMFREWRVDCKAILQPGQNQLRIVFFPAASLADSLVKASPYALPGEERVMVRKAQFHFGWDFAPRFATCGIWQPVFLETWNGVRITHLRIDQKKLEKENASLRACFTLESDKEQEITLSIEDTQQKFKLGKGITTKSLDFTVKKPKLWWCNGLGDAFMYSFSGKVLVEGTEMDETVVKTGLRSIELIQQPDSMGTGFYFKLNGLPIFMKGANLVPMDVFQNRVTDENYKHLVDNAKKSNFNMLRVWGGGIYQPDLFYELCDENGIMVWQDFMFACGMYPFDTSFLNNVRKEAQYQVRRLCNHPCMALWCGNNEISEGWHHWDWQDAFSTDQRKEIWNGYQKLFNQLLPEEVAANSTTTYWESSPKLGRGDPRHQFEGDSHYWGIWHDGEPFDMFEKKVPRFMTEFGFESYPDVKTLEQIAPKAGLQLNTNLLMAHQKQTKGDSTIYDYMKKEFKLPSDFENFIYLNQVLQAGGIMKGIEAHRRSKPYCMGSIYWQLNDCWPAASWSGIDYYGKWKALHYFVKKSFEPILISSAVKKDSLQIYLINDNFVPCKGKLALTWMNLSGKESKKEFWEVSIPSSSSQKIKTIRIDTLLKDGIIYMELTDGKNLIADKIYYTAKTKDLPLEKIHLQCHVKPVKDGFELSLTATKLVKNIDLDAAEPGWFSDNYFDMLPNKKYIIRFTPEHAVSELNVTYKSIVDTY